MNLNCLTEGSQAGAEYQHLRWMRLALLKRRNAGDGALLEGRFGFHCSVQLHMDTACWSDVPFAAFQSIIDNMTLSEAGITEYGDLFFESREDRWPGANSPNRILRELRTLTQQQ